ncbi:MAG: hypothetical protein KIS77_06945 [Saprospiraceae bacterium]|nr:hypothetical protein [Saprospiraceae bacterium]
MSALNPAQREILQLLARPMSERDLAELKAIIIEFLAKKTVAEADKAFDERGYSQADIESWKQGHKRVKTSSTR